MKTFKQYLSEIIKIELPRATRRYGSDLGKKLPKDSYNHISNVSDDHKLHIEAGHKINTDTSKKLKSDHSVGDMRKYAITNKNGKITMMMRTELVNPHKNTIKVHSVTATKDNEVPAHKIYSHLIQHHNHVIVSDDIQSVGGAKLWHKLSKEKGVNVHGFNMRTNKAVNLGDHLEHPDHDTEVYADSDDHHQDNDYIDRMNTVLIAHKK